MTGFVAAGVTRDSLLKLGAELGYAVEERTVTIDEWLADAGARQMTEAFACGTAAVITPIGALKNPKGVYQIRDGSMGPVSARLREDLMDIQYGLAADSHGWMHRVV